jgi:hypothetical protein
LGRGRGAVRTRREQESHGRSEYNESTLYVYENVPMKPIKNVQKEKKDCQVLGTAMLESPSSASRNTCDLVIGI